LCHTCIESAHKLFVLFGAMISCTIFPHHIRDSCCFCYSEMLYVLIYILVTSLYLSNDRQYVYRLDVDDFYGFVALSITCMNGDGHSCCEEKFHESGAATAAAFVEMFLSGLHRCECLYGSFRFCTERFQGMRMEAACGETTVYHVPIYGRQPCQLACISLYSLIRHAFFLWKARCAFPALALSRRASPLLSNGL